jgi:predicted ATP-dependent endonuclease of OLD family
MQDVFITKIHVEKVRHLENVEILLSETERKHLILTGKNGSGKTSLLEAMRNVTSSMQRITVGGGNHLSIANARQHLASKNKNSVDVSYSKNDFKPIDIVSVYIPARRNSFDLPKAIESVEIKDKTKIDSNKSTSFLKYILSLDYQLYGAQNDNNKELEASLKKWFDNFTIALQEIYSNKELKLQRDTKRLAFMIEMPGREPFGLHEMADGYKAFLEIFMELIMRFENTNAVVEYGQSAIVLIDELETHLHVELQKRALPFLTRLFPNVQFVVTSHSPFVITSPANAIVYDLENHIRLDGDLTEYSYTDIVEGYFDVSECSANLKSDFDRYVRLCNMDAHTLAEREEIRRLFERLSKIPGTSPLSTAFYMFERGRRNGKNK